MSSESAHETVAIASVMDAATAAWLNRQRTEELERAALEEAYQRGAEQSAAETEAEPLAAARKRGARLTKAQIAEAELLVAQRDLAEAKSVIAETNRDLNEALDEVARLIALNSTLKNQVALLEEKLASRGGGRGPSQAILDRQNRCRPRFLEAAAVEGVGTNAADLVAEGLSLKGAGWQLNDIYAVAAQAEAAGLVVKRSKGRKAFWYTPDVLARMEERVVGAREAQAVAAKPEDEVVIDLT